MATRYWVGGAGTWSTSTTKWSATSGGAGGASAPTAADDVIINTASGSASYTITLSGTLNCKSLTIAGPATGTVTIAGSGTSILNVNGEFTLAATGVAWTQVGTINFVGSTAYNINTNGVILATVVTVSFNTPAVNVTLLSNLNLTAAAITLTAGGLKLNNFNLTAKTLTQSSSTVQYTIDFANSSYITIVGNTLSLYGNLLSILGDYPLIKTTTTGSVQYRTTISEARKISLEHTSSGTVTLFNGSYINDFNYSGTSGGSAGAISLGGSNVSINVYGDVDIANIEAFNTSGSTIMNIYGVNKTIKMSTMNNSTPDILVVGIMASYTALSAIICSLYVNIIGVLITDRINNITAALQLDANINANNASVLYYSNGITNYNSSITNFTNLVLAPSATNPFPVSGTSFTSKTIYKVILDLSIAIYNYTTRFPNINILEITNNISGLQLDAPLTVNTLIANGTNGQRVSITAGQSYVLNAVVSHSLSNVNFTGITSTTTLSGTRLSNGGGNVNINFDAPRNLYVRSTGNIDTVDLFSTTVNGADRDYRLWQDILIFDALSTGTYALASNIGGINTTNFSGTITGTSITLGGDLVLGNTGTIASLSLNFFDLGNIVNITVPTTYSFSSLNIKGSVKLNSNIKIAGASIFISGTFSTTTSLDLNDYDLYTTSLSSSITNVSTIDFKTSGNIFLTGTSASVLSLTGTSAITMLGNKNIEILSTVIPTGNRTISITSDVKGKPNLKIYNGSTIYTVSLGILHIDSLDLTGVSGTTFLSTGETNVYDGNVVTDSLITWNDTYTINTYGIGDINFFNNNNVSKPITVVSGTTTLKSKIGNKVLTLVSGTLSCTDTTMEVGSFVSTGTLTRILNAAVSNNATLTLLSDNTTVWNVSGSNISINYLNGVNSKVKATATTNITILNSSPDVNFTVYGTGNLDINTSTFKDLAIVGALTISNANTSFNIYGKLDDRTALWTNVTSGTLNIFTNNSANINTEYPRDISVNEGVRIGYLNIQESGNYNTVVRNINIIGQNINNKTIIDSLNINTYDSSNISIGYKLNNLFLSYVDINNSANIIGNVSGTSINTTIVNSNIKNLDNNFYTNCNITLGLNTIINNNFSAKNVYINSNTVDLSNATLTNYATLDTSGLTSSTPIEFKKLILGSTTNIKYPILCDTLEIPNMHVSISSTIKANTISIIGNPTLYSYNGIGTTFSIENLSGKGVYGDNVNIKQCNFLPIGSLILGPSSIDNGDNTGIVFTNPKTMMSMF